MIKQGGCPMNNLLYCYDEDDENHFFLCCNVCDLLVMLGCCHKNNMLRLLSIIRSTTRQGRKFYVGNGTGSKERRPLHCV